MDKREQHQQQKRKQIYLTAQKAALAARLMALNGKTKNQTDDEEMEASIRYVKRKLEYSAYTQFKIGHWKIESERWVCPPFQFFMAMGKPDNELEQHFLHKELDDKRKKRDGQERRNSDQEKCRDYDDDDDEHDTEDRGLKASKEQLRETLALADARQMQTECEPMANRRGEELQQDLTISTMKEEEVRNAEKAKEYHKQEDLSKQLEESTVKQIMPIRRQMKIQMAKETWFDMLAFVLRYQLGQIVPEIGDRQFAGIVQPFLHNYREITLGNISIFKPKDGSNHPSLRVRPKFAGWHDEPWDSLSPQIILPDVEMPKNIKDFLLIKFCFLDMSVMNFLSKFQQNSLLWNVNLDLSGAHRTKKSELVKTLSHVLPLINNIDSIRGRDILQLGSFYDACGFAIDMLKMARFYEANCYFTYHFAHKEIKLINRWLATPRDDGRPRVLIFPEDGMFTDFCKVSHLFDDRIKRFSKTKHSCSFFIRLWVRDTVEWQGDICMENGHTKEKLVIKKVAWHKDPLWSGQKMALISRYSSNADKKWIEANEREVLDWNFEDQNGRIDLHYARFEFFGAWCW